MYMQIQTPIHTSNVQLNSSIYLQKVSRIRSHWQHELTLSFGRVSTN